MATAQHRAFSTQEVLEIILVQLSLKDLLINVQRVNRLFHDVIASSHPLQQALFFRPVETKGPSNTTQRINPLLRDKFPPWFEDSVLMARTVVLLDHKHFWSLDWNTSKEKTEAYARKDASWRRMLVSQPPVKEVEVKMRVEARGGTSQSKGELRPEDGLRMGLFYDIVEHFIEHQPVSNFVIQWHLPPVWERDISRNVGYVTIYLRRVRQCESGMTGEIGSEFKSLDFKKISIDYHEEPRADSLLFVHS